MAFVQPVKALQLFAFQSTKERGDLLSTNLDEIYQIQNLHAKDWIGGPFGFVPSLQISGTAAIYRFINPKSKDHFFTNDQDEGSRAIKYLGYQSEAISCFLFTSEQAAAPWVSAGGEAFPIYRWEGAGYHFYRVDGGNDASGRIVGTPPQHVKQPRYEGILGYGISQPTPPVFTH